MEWSKFNILCKSPEGRNYLYNSRMNLLLKLPEDTYASLWKNQQNFSLDKLKGDLDEESLDFFIKNKVIVDSGEDDNFLLQKKLLRYKRSLDEKNVGFVIVPTYGCNFKCPYCYESNLPMDIMSERVEDQLVRFIKSFGINEFPISWHGGGEPLLAFRRIKSILYKLRDENIKLSDHKLVTNGFLLDDEKCAFFNDFNLQSIQITIDGLEGTHNMSRIHKSEIPTYDIIIQNIERVFRLMPNCRVIVRVNVHKGNEEEFPVLHKQLRKRWEGQNFEISMKYVNDHNNGCKIACLKDQDKIRYIEKLVKKDNFSSLSLYPKPKLSGCTATFLNSYVIGTGGESYISAG